MTMSLIWWMPMPSPWRNDGSERTTMADGTGVASVGGSGALGNCFASVRILLDLIKTGQ